MRIEEKEILTRRGDASSEAIARRLKAARCVVTKKQKVFADLVELSATTYNSQEKRGAPSIPVMEFLYRNHRIDFNFILYGDFLTLPGDVQDKLFAALREIDSASGTRPS